LSGHSFADTKALGAANSNSNRDRTIECPGRRWLSSGKLPQSSLATKQHGKPRLSFSAFYLHVLAGNEAQSK
jgi:hypothetical protein